MQLVQVILISSSSISYTTSNSGCSPTCSSYNKNVVVLVTAVASSASFQLLQVLIAVPLVTVVALVQFPQVLVIAVWAKLCFQYSTKPTGVYYTTSRIRNFALLQCGQTCVFNTKPTGEVFSVLQYIQDRNFAFCPWVTLCFAGRYQPER